MHNPSHVALARPDGGQSHYVVCAECAELGKEQTLTTPDGVYVGVIYGPIANRQFAEVLVDAHRTNYEHRS
jgi:hypothetical protein